MLHTQLGRFTQRDPLGYVDGMSLYEYVRSNPVLWLDSFGLETLGAGDPAGEVLWAPDSPADTWVTGPGGSYRMYPDLLSAITDRLDQAVKETARKGKEVCGMVCKNCATGKRYTTKTTGLETFCLPQLAPCRDGDKAIRMWHTHPEESPFSDVDEWWSDTTDLPFHMDYPGNSGPPVRYPPVTPWDEGHRWPGPWRGFLPGKPDAGPPNNSFWSL